jgi:hypothetical protein
MMGRLEQDLGILLILMLELYARIGTSIIGIQVRAADLGLPRQSLDGFWL